MRHELAGVARTRLHRILASHLDVAAQGKSANAVIGIPAAETKQTLAEPERENINAHAAKFGYRIVAELVDEDHDSQNEGHSYYGIGRTDK